MQIQWHYKAFVNIFKSRILVQIDMQGRHTFHSEYENEEILLTLSLMRPVFYVIKDKLSQTFGALSNEATKVNSI